MAVAIFSVQHDGLLWEVCFLEHAVHPCFLLNEARLDWRVVCFMVLRKGAMLLRAAFGMAAKMVVVAIGCHNRIDLRYTTCKSTFFFVCAQFSGQIRRRQCACASIGKHNFGIGAQSLSAFPPVCLPFLADIFL